MYGQLRPTAWPQALGNGIKDFVTSLSVMLMLSFFLFIVNYILEEPYQYRGELHEPNGVSSHALFHLESCEMIPSPSFHQ